MKVPFYLKLFFAFILFASLLLGFSIFIFNSFYKMQTYEKEMANVKSILNHKEGMLTDYILRINQKLEAIKKSLVLKKYLNDEEKISNVEDIFKVVMSSNQDILQMKFLSLHGKEKIRINSINKKLNVVLEDDLQNESIQTYFKEIRNLKDGEIWQSSFDINREKGEIKHPIQYIIRFILKTKKGFVVIVLDAKQIFDKIQNSFESVCYILDKDGYFLIHKDKKYNWSRYFASSENIYKLFPNEGKIILESNNFLSSKIISKRVYVNYEDYVILLISFNNIEEKEYFKELEKHLYVILLIGIILSVLLSILFSRPIAKLNTQIEKKNKDLDLMVKQSYQQLNESQKIIDKHVISMRLDVDGMISDVSSAFCDITGFSKNELIGHPHKILMHPDMSDIEYDKIWENINKKGLFKGELKGIKKDGGYYWVESFFEPIYSNSGEIIGYTAIRNNITDKKIIQSLYSDLNYQIEQSNAILENAYSGIGLIDLNGNFKKVNKVFTELLGFSNAELLKKSCFDIIKKSSKNLLRRIIVEAQEIGSITNIEKVFVDNNGKEIHLEISLNLLPDKLYFVLVVNSLEDKRKLQEFNQDLVIRIKDEVEKSRQKDKIHQEEQIKNAKLTSIGSLAAGITHEINTPLTYIKGNFEMMGYDIEDLPSSEIKNRMASDSEKINDGLRRIENIVESMREISQSSSEVKENVNIYSTIITSLTMAYNRSKQISRIYLNNKLFTIDDINKNEYTYFSNVQKQRLEQVWIVITNNALDELLSINDYEKRAIYINIFQEEDEIIVKFIDNAGGIKDDMHDKLFDPFVSTKEHSGMGVGLNIAKKIINEQNGKITAYNENDGAVFEVRLKKCE